MPNYTAEIAPDPSPATIQALYLQSAPLCLEQDSGQPAASKFTCAKIPLLRLNKTVPTDRLYYNDSFTREFTAEVTSCDPEPIKSAPPSRWRVRLDRTTFYPTSGGQPHDTGQLGPARVLDVIDEGGDVIHIVDHSLPPGQVTAHIDWPRRFDHMQQHTGQHLLSAIFQQKFSLPTVSFHLGAELCTIDLRGGEPTQQLLDAAAGAANQIVYDDRAVNVKYGTAEELAAAGVRKTVGRSGILRAIEIEALELQPCGGTHVKRTGQIGTILLRSLSKVRQDWRIEFACGQRVEKLARTDFAILKNVAAKLNCAPQETATAAERLTTERDAHFKSARAATEKLAALEAHASVAACEVRPDGLRIVARVIANEPPEFVLSFARDAVKTENVVALLVHAETGDVYFARHAALRDDMNALLKQSFAHVPGKGGGTSDFARGRLLDPARSLEFLVCAVALSRPGT
jgi:alanyl-tRNA synthetase